jgi:magnesium chelatase family protein
MTDFSEIRGQEHAKRALEVALAGGHSVLLMGPSGCGKTMLIAAAERPGNISNQEGATLKDLVPYLSQSHKGASLVLAESLPCPCGFLGDPKHECTCQDESIEAFRREIPFDQFGIYIEVPAVSFRDLSDTRQGESGDSIFKRVLRAREIQVQRGDILNQGMTAAQMNEHCKVTAEGSRLLEMCVDRLGISARAYFTILKVARTIADLDDSANIQSVHLSEAIQYRHRHQPR